MTNNRLTLESACDFYCIRHLDIMRSVVGLIHSGDDSSADQTEMLHRMRTSSRRIIEILSAKNRFLQRDTGKSLQKHSRKLLKISGRLRDLDVQLNILNELIDQENGDKAGCALRDYQKWLGHQRDMSQLYLHGRLDNDLKSKLDKEAESLSTRSSIGYDTESCEAYTLIEAGPAIFYTAAADIIAAGRMRSQLHELRVKCKGFRYILELFELAGIDSAGFQAEFKELQDIFGSWHDDHALLKQLRKFSRSCKCDHDAVNTVGTLLAERERSSRKRAEEMAGKMEQSWFDSAFASMFLGN